MTDLLPALEAMLAILEPLSPADRRRLLSALTAALDLTEPPTRTP
jgi:hypothetical protein